MFLNKKDNHQLENIYETTLDEHLIQQPKIQAVKEGINANNILKRLFVDYLKKQA